MHRLHLTNAKGLNLEQLKKAIISEDTKLPAEFEIYKKDLLAFSEKNLRIFNEEAEKKLLERIGSSAD